MKKTINYTLVFLTVLCHTLKINSMKKLLRIKLVLKKMWLWIFLSELTLKLEALYLVHKERVI